MALGIGMVPLNFSLITAFKAFILPAGLIPDLRTWNVEDKQ